MIEKETIYVDPVPEIKQMQDPFGSNRPFAILGLSYLVVAAALPICWAIGILPVTGEGLGYCEIGAFVTTFGGLMIMASVCSVKEEERRLRAAMAAPVMTLKELMGYEGRRVWTYSRNYPILRCGAEDWLHVDKELFAFALTRCDGGYHDGGDGYSYCGFELDLTDFALWLEKCRQQKNRRERARENLLKNNEVS